MKYLLLLITALALAACSGSDAPTTSAEVYEFYPDGTVKSIGNYKDGQHPNADPGFRILETYQIEEISMTIDELRIRELLSPTIPNMLGLATVKQKTEIDNRIKDWKSEDAGFRFLWSAHADDIAGKQYYSLYAVRIPKKYDLFIDGSSLSATKILEENGQILLDITLLPEAATRFEQMTTNNINRPLAIVFGDKVVSAPTVVNTISGGKLQISGNFTNDEARELKEVMDSHILNGEWRAYHPNGKLKEIRNYENGERVGSWSTYDQNGKLIKKYEK